MHALSDLFLMRSSFALDFSIIGCLLLLATYPCYGLDPSETNATAQFSTAVVHAPDTNSYSRLQEQLAQMRAALDQSRKSSAEAAAANAQEVTIRLQSLERQLNQQHAASQQSSQTNLQFIIFGSVLCCLATLVAVYFQWRGFARLDPTTTPVRIGTQPRPNLSLDPAADPKALAPFDSMDKSSLRLNNTLERLERRLLELERPEQPPLVTSVPTLEPMARATLVSAESRGKAPLDHAQVLRDEGQALLGQGQALLNQSKPHEALACFELLLALDPDHTVALVKKGAALENLKKLDEAMDCYDRALALDGSMTLAHLFKGGLYYRMDRFGESMECYKHALLSQGKRHSAT